MLTVGCAAREQGIQHSLDRVKKRRFSCNTLIEKETKKLA
jgi:hypothetical protein